MKNIVAIIPARGGSKGIPSKNIINFCGKPLLAWSIIQAKTSEHISSVWVTSDDDDILNIASEYGAKTIKRPSDISQDDATSESAWIHAIDKINNIEENIDLVVGIQATSPIRASQDFDNAINLFIAEKMDSLFASCLIKDRFVWEYNNKNLIPVNYNYKKRQIRQKIPTRFIENGSFYIFSPSLIKKENNRLGGKIGKYKMKNYKVFQIDEPEDLTLCEIIMKGYGLDKL